MKSDKVTNNAVYVHLDGDGIGDRLELLLIDGDIVGARSFSKSVSDTIAEVCASIEAVDGAQIVLAGGDDIIASIPSKSWDLKKIEEIRMRFVNKTGCTLSCGVGTSIQTALNNLRRAKLSGKNRIVSRE